MTFQDYFRIIRRRGWIIILLALLTAIAAFAFSKLQTPIYKSSVNILVQPARADLGLTQSAKILLRSYVSWMDTETRAQAVIDQLSLDRVPGDLRSDVAIASDDSRLAIQLTVEDPDGDLANDIAQAWTDLFVQWRNEQNADQNKQDQVEAIQLDPPRYGLASPKWKVNVMAGAVFGALIGGVIVFVLEWIESGVVRRPDDVDRYLSLPLLGTIPAARIDVHRPYLLGGRSPSAPAGPPPGVRSAAPSVPYTPPADEPPAAPAEPVEAAAPPSVPAEPDVPSEPAPPAEPDEQDEQDAGPVEPTILLSKGD